MRLRKQQVAKQSVSTEVQHIPPQGQPSTLSRSPERQPATTSPPEDQQNTEDQQNPEDQPSTSGTAQEDTSTSDSDFDPEQAILKDPDVMIEEFVADWVASLPRDDLYSLSLLLFHILKQEFSQLVYPASKVIGRALNRNHKTVQKWRVKFIKNVKTPKTATAQ